MKSPRSIRLLLLLRARPLASAVSRSIMCIVALQLAQAVATAGTRFKDILVESIVIDQRGNTIVCGQSGIWGSAKRAIKVGDPTHDSVNVGLRKISRAGELLLAVEIGGSSIDRPSQILRDNAGNLIIVGDTVSTNFPGMPPITKHQWLSFITKLDATGTNLLFTRTFESPRTDVTAAAVDLSGNIYVTGETEETDWEIIPNSAVPPGQQRRAFILKLNAIGDVVFGRRFGGSVHDFPVAIAIDAEQNIYVAGTSTSPDFPVVNTMRQFATGFEYDSFVTKVSADGTHFLYSVFLGATFNRYSAHIAVNAAQEALVVATSEARPYFGNPYDLPPLYSTSPRAVIVKLAGDGSSLLRTQFLDFNMPVAVTSLLLLPDSEETVIVGGNADQDHPFVVAVDASDKRRASRLDAVLRGGNMRVEALARDRLGRISVGASALRRGYYTLDTVIFTSSFFRKDAGRPRMISPRLGTVYASGAPVVLTAAAPGFHPDMSEAHFYDGRMLIAVVTNAPYTITWTNASPGMHSLRAAVVAGNVPTFTDPVRIEVRSLANDEPAGAIALQGDRASVRGSTFGATRTDLHGADMKDVWYKWTAPRDGVFRLRFGDDNESLDILVLTNLYDRAPVQHLRSESGVDYLIRVGGWESNFRLVIEPIANEPNDDFADRLKLEGIPVSVKGSVANASRETFDPVMDADRTVWYSWTAPKTGSFLVTLKNGFYGNLFLSRGASPTNSVGPASQDRGNPRAIFAEAGEDICIAVLCDGAYATHYPPLDFTLNVNEIAPPLNDQFSERFAIFGAPLALTNLSLGSSFEPDEPQHYRSLQGSLWWTWVAPSNGLFLIKTAPPWEFSHAAIAVYVGESLANLARVGDPVGDTEVVLRANGGRQYQIAVIDNGTREQKLSISSVSPPSNDNFADAQLVAGAFAPIVGSTLYSTLEPGETPYEKVITNSVWFRWVAPSNGWYFIGNDWTYNAVFEGQAIGSLYAIQKHPGHAGFYVKGGTEYRIAVAGQSRNFAMQIRPLSRPSNDDFINRATVSGREVTLSGNLAFATRESGEPGYFDSLWWSWTAPQSGAVVLESTNGNNLAVYTGDTLTTLERVAGDYRPRLTFSAEAGRTYAISVSGWGAEAKGHLHYPDPPANDARSHATRFIETEFADTCSNAGATRDADEREFSGWWISAGRTLWWFWIPRSTATVTLSTDGSDFRTTLEVFSAASNELPLIAFADGLRSEPNAAVTMQVRAWEPYLIRIDGYDAAEFGTVRLRALIAQNLEQSMKIE